jgi:hypothetical protein
MVQKHGSAPSSPWHCTFGPPLAQKSRPASQMQSGSQAPHCPFRQTWPGAHEKQSSPPVPQNSNSFPGRQPVSPSQQPFGQLWEVQQGAAQKLPSAGQGNDSDAAATQTAPGA